MSWWEKKKKNFKINLFWIASVDSIWINGGFLLSKLKKEEGVAGDFWLGGGGGEGVRWGGGANERQKCQDKFPCFWSWSY